MIHANAGMTFIIEPVAPSRGFSSVDIEAMIEWRRELLIESPQLRDQITASIAYLEGHREEERADDGTLPGLPQDHKFDGR